MGRCSTDNPAMVSSPFRPPTRGAVTLAAEAVADSRVTERASQVPAQVEREAKLAGPVIRAGRLALDTGRMEANAGHGPVRLTRQEFLLLKEFASHPGRTVSRAVLLAAVWGLNFDPGSNVVDACVRRLRSKLGFDLIRTVRGKGYQLLAELSPASPELRDAVGQPTEEEGTWVVAVRTSRCVRRA